MTLTKAEEISDHVISLLAGKAPTAFCRRSQLLGHSFPTISNALSLVIAKRRQVAGVEPAMRSECHDFAQKANAFIWALHMAVIPDEDADRLAQLKRDTTEFNRGLSEALQHRQQVCAEEWDQTLRLEKFDSFDNYCWTLDPFDPLYWQRIYTHLSLPYNQSSPSGNPSLAIDTRGNLTWEIKANAHRRRVGPVEIFAWGVLAITLIWLVFKWSR